MENVEEITKTESANLDAVASDIARRLSPVRPNSFFRSALKARLTRSKIYARRKAAGALSVVWLIAALLAVIAGELIYVVTSPRCRRARSGVQR